MRLRHHFAEAVLLFCTFAAPPGALAEEGRYVIVRKDGAITVLQARPKRRGTTYVGRLTGGSQLVSFPATDVDEARTEEANRPPPTPTPPGRAPVLKRVAPRPEATPRLRVPRSEAERSLANTASADPSSSPPADGGVSPKVGATPREALDAKGHGEAWWRRRAAPVLIRIATAEAALARATAKRDDQQRSPGQGTASRLKGSRLNDAVTRAQDVLDGERRKLELLSEEARKAGAYPGWLR